MDVANSSGVENESIDILILRVRISAEQSTARRSFKCLQLANSPKNNHTYTLQADGKLEAEPSFSDFLPSIKLT
jgi:hypothetical protein